MAKKKKFIKVHKNVLTACAILLVLIAIPVSITSIILVGGYMRVYEGVYVNSVPVGGLTKEKALETLSQKTTVPQKLTFKVSGVNGDYEKEVETSDLDVQLLFNKSIEDAYHVGREGNLLSDLQTIIKTRKNTTSIKTPIEINDEKVKTLTKELLANTTPAVYPQLVLRSGNVSLKEGSDGEEITEADLKELIFSAILEGQTVVNVYPREVKVLLSEEEKSFAVSRGKLFLNKKLNITLNGQTVETVKVDKLLPIVDPKGSFYKSEINTLAASFGKSYTKETAEPVFNFEGGRVIEFSAGVEGISINKEQLVKDLEIALASLEKSEEEFSFEIPHQVSKPKTSVSDVNNLGIKELIGTGTSRFAGSIPSRIYNVSLAAARINGVLVPPGETFSFANAIGDISKYTGYKEAYIIQGGKTILGDGGGVCQVSTTLFRAVMNAGLPIVERRAHAYRVGYYEQGSPPGLDATVFVPSVDFKFKNDTAHHILVQTKVDTKKLTAEFNIFGTKDGRVATVSKPVVTNQIEPAEDLYVDDPTLPTGKINHIEHKTWGARVTFNYLVQKDGQTIFEKNFVSVYQPWRNVFMRGTGPAI